jgi:hypothetical protein
VQYFLPVRRVLDYCYYLQKPHRHCLDFPLILDHHFYCHFQMRSILNYRY